MDLHVIDSTGATIEKINLPIKTTPQCLSKFKYSYKNQDQNIKVYNPREHTGYYLYAHNLDDSIFYLVHPSVNTYLDNTTFILTIGDLSSGECVSQCNYTPGTAGCPHNTECNKLTSRGAQYCNSTDRYDKLNVNRVYNWNWDNCMENACIDNHPPPPGSPGGPYYQTLCIWHGPTPPPGPPPPPLPTPAPPTPPPTPYPPQGVYVVQPGDTGCIQIQNKVCGLNFAAGDSYNGQCIYNNLVDGSYICPWLCSPSKNSAVCGPSFAPGSRFPYDCSHSSWGYYTNEIDIYYEDPNSYCCGPSGDGSGTSVCNMPTPGPTPPPAPTPPLPKGWCSSNYSQSGSRCDISCDPNASPSPGKHCIPGTAMQCAQKGALSANWKLTACDTS